MLLPAPLYVQHTKDIRVYLSCSRTTLLTKWKNCFCINRLTIEQLLKWRQQNCRALVATRGDCIHCDITQRVLPINPDFSTHIDKALDTLNDKLHEKNISGMTLYWLDESAWLEQFQATYSSTQTNSNVASSDHSSTNTNINQARRRLFQLGS